MIDCDENTCMMKVIDANDEGVMKKLGNDGCGRGT